MGGGPWHLCGGRVGSAAATARVRGGPPRVGSLVFTSPTVRVAGRPPCVARSAPAAGSTMPEGSGAGRVLGPEHPLAVRAAARLGLEQRPGLPAYRTARDPWEC